MTRKPLWFLLFTVSALLLFASGQVSEILAGETGLSKGQVIYVPVYSHIYYGDRLAKFKLAVTLSVRNTSLTRAITILKADYYDSKGQHLKAFLDKPLKIGPLGAQRFLVKESDLSGGSGASFIVDWEAEETVTMPVAQGIMIGTESNQGISFLTDGRVIEEK